jgi:hypothetical protein
MENHNNARRIRIFMATMAHTKVKNMDAKTPSETPVDIFGSRVPTTPPTKAPVHTVPANRTPKSL